MNLPIMNGNNNDILCCVYAAVSAPHPRSANDAQRPLSNDPLFSKEGADKIQEPGTHDRIRAIADNLKVCIHLFTFWD